MSIIFKSKSIFIISIVFFFLGCNPIPTGDAPISIIKIDKTTLQVGNYCILNASDSYKGAGDTLIYNWEQDDNNPIPINIFELIHDETKEIGFAVEGNYKFRLIVNNGIQDSEVDEIEFTVFSRERVQFEDPTLEVQIRYVLNKPTGKLSNIALLGVDSLRRYIFTGEDIYSLNGIEQCPNIEYLSMSHQNISDISPLSTLYKLKKLLLTQTWEIDNISALTNLTNLEYLEIPGNSVRDISPLAGLTNLKFLNILENPVEDCSPLGNLSLLDELWLSEASGVDLNFLNQMDSLYLLWATASNISDLSPISDRINLETINFSYNQISDISHLSTLSNLVSIYLKSNQIQDISTLQYLPKIEVYKLQNNLIEDIEPLVNNIGLGEGDVLVIYGNPLDSISVNEYIPALTDRGIIVYY